MTVYFLIPICLVKKLRPITIHTVGYVVKWKQIWNAGNASGLSIVFACQKVQSDQRIGCARCALNLRQQKTPSSKLSANQIFLGNRRKNAIKLPLFAGQKNLRCFR